jgi:hypothetical protein
MSQNKYPYLTLTLSLPIRMGAEREQHGKHPVFTYRTACDRFERLRSYFCDTTLVPDGIAPNLDILLDRHLKDSLEVLNHFPNDETAKKILATLN